MGAATRGGSWSRSARMGGYPVRTGVLYSGRQSLRFSECGTERWGALGTPDAFKPGMSTFSCESQGIFRQDPSGPVLLCPPIVVTGASEDPMRPAGKLIHVAWATRVDGEWHEAALPTALVANDATLEAILAPTGWKPLDERWHEFIVASAIEHISGNLPAAMAEAG